MVSRKLNKRKYRRMAQCKMCRNAGVRGRSSRSSRTSRTSNRMTRTRINAANRLFDSAFNSAVVKPIRRAFCCEANSDDISSSVQRENQQERENLKLHNKRASQTEREKINIDPRVASAFEERFGVSNLTIGKNNNIIAIREPHERRYLYDKGPYTYEYFEKYFGPFDAPLRWAEAPRTRRRSPQLPKKKPLNNYRAIPVEVVDKYSERNRKNKSAVRNTPVSKKRTQKKRGILGF